MGVPDLKSSIGREKHFVRWLDEIKSEAEEIILLGDVFDFWFEYQNVVPKGYVRLFAKLIELRETGIAITVFAGNHDMWYKSYLPEYLDLRVVYDHEKRQFFGKNFFLSHGDGLGPGDHGYKVMKFFIRHPIIRWLFSWIHPDIGMPMANKFSTTSRKTNIKHLKKHHGEREFLYQFVKSHAPQNPTIDYYIFGHRHLPQTIQMTANAQLIVLGDWITDFSYLEISADGVELKQFNIS